MIRRLRWSAVFLATPILFGAEPGDTLALGRKALLNDGVGTAWRLAQMAVSEAPDSAPAHEFAGEVLFRRGEFEPAQAEFRRAVKIDPNFALGWWGLARVSECAFLNRSAREYFERAYQLDPKDPRIVRDWMMRAPTRQPSAGEKFVSFPQPTGASEQEEFEQ